MTSTKVDFDLSNLKKIEGRLFVRKDFLCMFSLLKSNWSTFFRLLLLLRPSQLCINVYRFLSTTVLALILCLQLEIPFVRFWRGGTEQRGSIAFLKLMIAMHTRFVYIICNFIFNFVFMPGFFLLLCDSAPIQFVTTEIILIYFM